MAAPGDIGARAAAVRARIERAGGDPDRIRLVAVTKGFGAEAARAALAAGLHDLGESYVQELTAKAAAVTGDADAAGRLPRWHMIGRLQRNKVRQAAPHVTLWHSVDRLALGAEIARRAPGAAVLAQVAATGEPSKGGCPPDELPELLGGLAELGLEVRGLMAIGPLAVPAAARPVFRLVRELADRHGLPERSMGMTGDLEVAVEEGATIVRVGSALFGPRPERSVARH